MAKRRALIGLIGAGVIVAAAGLAIWQPWSNDDPNWLLSLGADAATLTENSDGTIELDLTDADVSYLAFTDRPDRQVTTISQELMERAWPALFQDSPPNAVLVEQQPAGTERALVIELTSMNRTNSGVRYSGRILGEEEAGSTVVRGLTLRADTPRQLGAVHLFIDDLPDYEVTVTCTGSYSQGTYSVRYPDGLGGESEIREFREDCENDGGTFSQG